MRQVYDGQIEVICPECQCTTIGTACRQYAGMPGVVDVGYKCVKCGHEWGFEYAGKEVI